MNRGASALLLALALCGFCGSALADRGAAPPPQGPPSAEQDARININEAAASQLVRLPGIGPSRAAAIIAERETRRYLRVEDIIRLPGISRSNYPRIRASIRVQ